eukprot:snap_masked-scaffold_21-processed-gene-5.84-mRNA-1 protein AED:0.05 eAED:0.05 QI:0/-1/0/1/-1/1/1/0/511
MEESSTSLLDTVKAFSWHSENLSFVVFGASGDLAKKKTYPALFDLYREKLLPENTVIYGFARSEKKLEDFRQTIASFLAEDPEKDDFLKICFYSSGQYDDEEAQKKLSEQLLEHHTGSTSEVENRVLYFALPPAVFQKTAKAANAVLRTKTGFNRVVVEKPFGHDTESAKQLASKLSEFYSEKELYRIDHYLGKELVQNMLVLRFGNTIFEPIWNKEHIKNVIITFKEDIGTQGRGGYFEKSGIIRDIMQNHLMQVLSLFAMECPIRLAGDGSSDYIRDEKVKVLKSMCPWRIENTVLGQYEGYLDDETVDPNSKRETYACVVFYIRNQRWDGVPFIMKAGKAMDDRKAEVRVSFKSPSYSDFLFNVRDDSTQGPGNQELVMRLQPDPTIYLKTNLKSPGLKFNVVQSELDLTYKERFTKLSNPEAYTRLIFDVLKGKQSNFVRNDELIAGWEIVTPLLKIIEDKNSNVDIKKYKFGSRGPKEADEMVRNAGYNYDSGYAEDWKLNKRQKL